MLLNEETVKREAFRLLCLLKSQKPIFEMTPDGQRVYGGSEVSSEPLFTLTQEFLEDE